ncbi:tRNA glutamyl-Q(34) synthetase GluQRS [uncultured Albimonas sp.]|uniref:tRNA glutamyl-Q(34) synthetase GluQRS n=1 Tax=uncultured Albimonas sp. TaxID=1331701 RepID=UPI0030EF3B59
MHTERFAPSPNGRLHLGHAFSAMLSHDAARAARGRFLLRIEDLDRARARPEFEQAIGDDLAWLGLAWPSPILRQSERADTYAAALATLRSRGLLYPCACTRKDILAALDAPQEGGPDGPVYPGTCRRHPPDPAAPHALRLDMAAAIEALGGAQALPRLAFTELEEGPQGERGAQPLRADWLETSCGDVVLARKDGAAAYHLAVVVDDAFQGVTHVTRGRDLFPATPIHRLLQALLDLPTPLYRHHRLIRDAAGRRLAKRDRDAGIHELREAGLTPLEIRARVGLP